MFSLFGNSQVPVEFESRKQLLTYSNIALWDVLESCEREGSLDTNIRNAVANNIPALLASHPAIRTIVFNGKESHRLYTREFGKEIALPHLVMPSTSPANTMKLERKLENWSHLKKLLEQ